MLAVLQAHQESQASGAPDPEASGPGQLAAAEPGPVPCSLGLLHSLHGLMDAADPTLRHRAFMLLRRLGGEPATLYRDIEEDDVGGAAGTGRPPGVNEVVWGLQGVANSRSVAWVGACGSCTSPRVQA